MWLCAEERWQGTGTDRLPKVYVDHLQLTDFRSYESVDLPLESGVTTFVGANGQGKTNLVEAIEYLSTMSSHRVASEVPLVRSGRPTEPSSTVLRCATPAKSSG